jgi:hypothetical protein
VSSTFYGWTLKQWCIAAAELGEHLTLRDFYRSAIGDSERDEFLITLQTRWYASHVYEPGDSPIVIPQTYRTREATR